MFYCHIYFFFLISPVFDFNFRTSTMSSATLCMDDEYAQIQLDDLDVLATLGVGGFGRVQLVRFDIFSFVLLWLTLKNFRKKFKKVFSRELFALEIT